MGEKQDVSTGNIGDRYLPLHIGNGTVFGHLNGIRQGGTANGVKIDPQYQMMLDAIVTANGAGTLQFDRLPLAVLKAQTIAGESPRTGNGQHGG